MVDTYKELTRYINGLASALDSNVANVHNIVSADLTNYSTNAEIYDTHLLKLLLTTLTWKTLV